MFQLLSMNLLRLLQPWKFTRNPAARPARRSRRVRPEVECLERRDTPAITYHGGALLGNVEVQPMYYGLDWATNTANLSQVFQLGSFLNKTVNSSYMDMLGNGGYGVGRGTSVLTPRRSP